MMINITELKALDFAGKTFVLDNDLLLFRCGEKLLSREKWYELGMPRYDGYVEEFDENHPLVKKIVEAGGIVRRGISGKTNYYVVKESQDYSGAKARDYLKQLEKGKPIIAITEDNLKMLLGIDEAAEKESKGVRYADKYEMIEIYEPSGTEIPVVKADNVYVDEIDISGDACREWEYTLANNKTTVYLTDYLGDAESITLPTTIEGKKVELTWARAKHGCRFRECKAKKVYVPGAYNEIPPAFFLENFHLEEIVLGAGIEEIGLRFCAGAVNLEKVAFPDTVKNVGWGCLAETKWASEQGNESIIGSVLVHKGPNRKASESAYQVPEGIQCIAQWAFTVEEGESRYITRLELPASMKYISEQAFSMLQLVTMRVPSTLEYIGSRAFLGTDIEHLYRSKKHEQMLIIGRILCAIYAENCGQELLIPEGVEIIADDAMQYIVGAPAQVNHVILPNSLKEIGKGVNWGTTLKQIDINDGLRKIGAKCFAGCAGLEKIDLPQGLEALEEGAFQLSGLKTVAVPGTVKEIKPHTFWKCEELETVYVGEGIETIAYSAFEGCKSLTAIKLPSTLKNIGYKAFALCESLKTITIPSTATINEEAFAECENIKIIKE